MHDGILTELKWQRASRVHNSTSQLAATSSQLTAYQGRQARGVAGIRFCFLFLPVFRAGLFQAISHLAVGLSRRAQLPTSADEGP